MSLISLSVHNCTDYRLLPNIVATTSEISDCKSMKVNRVRDKNTSVVQCQS